MDDGWIKRPKDISWFEAITMVTIKTVILIFFVAVVIGLIWGD